MYATPCAQSAISTPTSVSESLLAWMHSRLVLFQSLEKTNEYIHRRVTGLCHERLHVRYRPEQVVLLPCCTFCGPDSTITRTNAREDRATMPTRIRSLQCVPARKYTPSHLRVAIGVCAVPPAPPPTPMPSM